MAGLRARLYAGLESGIRGLTTALRVLHEGLWLGLLDRRHLHAVTRRQYLQWRHYREPAYNLEGLKPWEARAIERYFQGCESILVGSAGGGREVIGLARLGFRVTAFECSPELAAACSSLVDDQGLTARVLTAEPDRVPDGIPIHDGAILGWGAYMHIPGRAARVGFLRSIRAKVPPNGPLLLSYFVRRRDGRTLRWQAAIARTVRRLRLSSEPVEIGDSLERTFDHRFTESEIRSELKEAGFEVAFTAVEPYGHAVGIATPQPPAAGRSAQNR